MLNEKYESAKKELGEAIAKLEEQMNVDKSEKELHISKLERQITLSELKYMEEVYIHSFPVKLFGIELGCFICIMNPICADPNHASGNN